ncbi:unnamed protein product [Lactuca saligna]|uniref:RRM domain-containing protein n=1 Tax=Lactuca saligna TaxID=75948 RepID=A0AA35Z8A1_LACSI|nr:unnamed protein product [Lactuca saligna]
MVYSVSTPFYVINFPRDADVKSLWEVCDKVGKVADVYVAHKLIGKRCAFILFLKFKDELVLERKLREIWMESYLLFAFVAQFSWDVSNKGASDKKGQVITANPVEQVHRSNVHADARSSSYANVVKGDGCVKNKKGSVPVYILQGKEIDNPLSMKAYVFDKLRYIRLIPKLCILLKEEENGDKVDEGKEESFSMYNTPINSVRGVGFVDRKAGERFGSILCSISAQPFNDFIDDGGLIDMPMVGKRFIRVDVIVAKLSKLDQFLLLDAVSDRFDHL